MTPRRVGVVGVLLLLFGGGQVAFGLEKNVDITIDPQLIPQVIIELNNYTTFSKLDLKVSEEAEDDFYMRVARVSGSVNEADELLINGESTKFDITFANLLKAKTVSISGSFHNSDAVLLVNLYVERKKTDSPLWVQCEQDNFIPSKLKCNGQNNCESGKDEEGCDRPTTTPSGESGGMAWKDVQYLLTILLAGLFFILSPICIVIFLFYHRRMSAARMELERQQVPRPTQAPEVYTSVTPTNDVPPSYEDFHQLKTPPPPFHSLRPPVYADTTPSTSSSTTSVNSRTEE
ncbi:uncharacterized protein LOC110853297 [Folsomia candida]|uniref:Atrial natriuretic peptide-converting enzyme n=1 Tax=Folsomia candida TaxID=158441 RepID=A0A226DZF5_FOLCA|nr:uncharacterized protein LOC110853297 [Folsomia candida]OXA50673.1 Atrial natriuretic peptide-converting enzyme [Folsomia candida]